MTTIQEINILEKKVKNLEQEVKELKQKQQKRVILDNKLSPRLFFMGQ